MPVPHDGLAVPSPWVRRFAHLVPAGGLVLDVAAGGGRHTRFFRTRGHRVVAIDRNLDGMADLVGAEGMELIQADLESGEPWPLQERRFAGIVVTNYLFRPLLPRLTAALEPGGMLIYETFAQGNEQFGRPSNPDFLLAPNELLKTFGPELTVVGYEHGIVYTPRPAAVQRIAGIKDRTLAPL